MKKILINALFSIILCFPSISHAQLHKISGTVVAFNKFPLHHIMVSAKKSKEKAITDENGNFELPVLKNDLIVINDPVFLEYKKKINDSDSIVLINLIMHNDDYNMNLAVNNGYIGKKDLEYGRTNLRQYNNPYIQCEDVFQAIRHALPESKIIIENGKRGVQLRGEKSLLYTNMALIVVDGIVVDDPSYLSTVNISNITKLSPSQCSMLYGMRGANGVVNIETFH